MNKSKMLAAAISVGASQMESLIERVCQRVHIPQKAKGFVPDKPTGRSKFKKRNRGKS